MGSDGRIYVNSNKSYQYQSNVWYDIRFEIDWGDKKFDYYVNDTLISEDFPFDYVYSVTTIYLYNYHDSQVWWDDIFVGAGLNCKWLKVKPDSGSVNPGETSQVNVDFNSTQLGEGKHIRLLKIHNNTPHNETIAVPCTLIVDGIKSLSI